MCVPWLQGLYWTLPRDRVEELEDGEEEEEEEEQRDEASAASLVEGSIHSDKPESGGGERGEPLVRPSSCVGMQRQLGRELPEACVCTSQAGCGDASL